MAAERAIADASTCLPAHGHLATLLAQLDRARDAEQVIVAALELSPGGAEAYDSLGYACLLLNRHERASALYRRATELAPGNSRYWYSLARTDHLDELRDRLRHARSVVDAVVYLGYALAKELDDLGQFEEAFGWFTTAARARRSQLQYDVASDERTLRQIAAAFPRVDAAAQRAPCQAGAQPIFIVGLPRSGSTLVERVLGGLPQVESNGETDHFSRALTAAARGPGDIFARAAAADPHSVALHYSRRARLAERTGWVIEKQPTNYLYLGAIRRAFPDASLLLVSRSPIDVCFAMFRTLFGAAFPFTYDFGELARYYAVYDELVRHWRATFGDALQEVVYEDLVREPRSVAAAMARGCGLTWREEAIAIEKNRGISLTASASQIRRPIYRTSIGRWRPYRRQLTPLIEALRARGIALDGEFLVSGP
jgi:tetratricopeptide (TPR) repeat protein